MSVKLVQTNIYGLPSSKPTFVPGSTDIANEDLGWVSNGAIQQGATVGAKDESSDRRHRERGWLQQGNWLVRTIGNNHFFFRWSWMAPERLAVHGP